MVTPAGRVKVADFGISSSVSESMSRISVRADSSGTPTYMSPQQVSGNRASHLDDIYALGSTIYELLTSKPPFFRGNAAAIYGQVLHVVPPPMAVRRDELEVFGQALISPEWEETIAACLAKEPEERPQSAGEVLAHLRESPRLARSPSVVVAEESCLLNEPDTVPATHARPPLTAVPIPEKAAP